MRYQISYQDVRITVKRQSVADKAKYWIIVGYLFEGMTEEQIAATNARLLTQFADLCSVTTDSKGLPFNPTMLSTTDSDTVKTAFSRYQELDNTLIERWQKGFDVANRVADPDFAPIPIEDAPKND